MVEIHALTTARLTVGHLWCIVLNLLDRDVVLTPTEMDYLVIIEKRHEITWIDNMTETLYEQDYYFWLEKTADLLQNGRLSELDIPNLIEEIEDMGRGEKRAVESNLVVIMMHLLKYKYQPEERSNSWKSTTREHRRRLRKAFKDSPSLKPFFVEVVDECYQDARLQAADETGLSLETFPVQSPFTPEEALNPDYLPEKD